MQSLSGTGLRLTSTSEFQQYTSVFASNCEHYQQKLIAEAYQPARHSKKTERLRNIVRELGPGAFETVEWLADVRWLQRN